MFGADKAQATQAASMTAQDGAVSEAWGISPAEWLALTSEARRDYRDRIVYAPQLASVLS